MQADKPQPTAQELRRERELQQIQSALRGLRYGSVQITLQDGIVVQIDRTEKTRLPRLAQDKTDACR